MELVDKAQGLLSDMNWALKFKKSREGKAFTGQVLKEWHTKANDYVSSLAMSGRIVRSMVPKAASSSSTAEGMQCRAWRVGGSTLTVCGARRGKVLLHCMPSRISLYSVYFTTFSLAYRLNFTT